MILLEVEAGLLMLAHAERGCQTLHHVRLQSDAGPISLAASPDCVYA